MNRFANYPLKYPLYKGHSVRESNGCRTLTQLGIKEGDKLEIMEKNGVIQLIPVVVYPKKLIKELRTEIDEMKVKIAGKTTQVRKCGKAF